MKIGDFNIVNSESEKLLGVKFDYKLLSTSMYQAYVKTLAE